MQHVLDGINAAIVFEGEVLVIQYHPLLTLLEGETFDVGEHSYRYQHHTTVGKIDGHHAAFLSEVELLDSKVGVFILAHNRLFYSFDLYFFTVEHLIDESVDFVPMLVDSFDYHLLLRGGEFRPRHLYFLLTIFLNPNLSYGIASVRLLTSTLDDMHVPSILVLVGRENGENKT